MPYDPKIKATCRACKALGYQRMNPRCRTCKSNKKALALVQRHDIEIMLSKRRVVINPALRQSILDDHLMVVQWNQIEPGEVKSVARRCIANVKKAYGPRFKMPSFEVHDPSLFPEVLNP